MVEVQPGMAEEQSVVAEEEESGLVAACMIAQMMPRWWRGWRAVVAASEA